MRVIGLNAIGHHDASACLVEDGRVVCFVEEERISRNKHAIGQVPRRSLQWCLETAGLSITDVDAIATPWVEEEGAFDFKSGRADEVTFGVMYDRTARASPTRLARLVDEFAGGRTAPPIAYVSHHLAHAASAYRCSGLSEATVIVVDGQGDRVSTTIAHGSGGRLQSVLQLPTVDSLGHFYAEATRVLGFGSMAEGKTMGLASYGQPAMLFEEFELHDDGYSVDLSLDVDRWASTEQNTNAIARAWRDRLWSRVGALRTPERPMSLSATLTAIHDWPSDMLDFAASVQAELERVLTHLVTVAVGKTGCPDVVYAGGVALNCAANGAIRDLDVVRSLFIQPIAGDGGAPIGAALETNAVLSGDVVDGGHRMRSVALGPSFTDDEIGVVLHDVGARAELCDDPALAAADEICAGRAVGWFQGRMEGGPRALGNRSILGDPTRRGSHERLNHIKHRAQWRPIAPAILRSQASSVFERDVDSPFMIEAATVRDEWRSRLPAVTHIDATARPQTVEAEVNPAFTALLGHVQDSLGVGCVANTSFNHEREPIVCTPRDAVATFFATPLDTLVLGRWIVRKGRRAE